MSHAGRTTTDFMTTEKPIQPQTQSEPQAPALRSGDLFGDGTLRIRNERQGVLFVDATPDDEYPLRILRAYLDNAEGSYVESEPPLIGEIMNQAQRDRAVILRRAIERLSSPNTQVTHGRAQP